MPLKEKINSEIKEAMKAGAGDKLSLLRGLLASIHNQEIQKKTSGNADPISDEEILQVLQKEAKKRKEAAELMRSGGREDLAEKEEAEMKMIQEYLPAQMSEEEIRGVVEKLFAAGNSEFNTLIKESMKELKGRADGQTVSRIVKEKTG